MANNNDLATNSSIVPINRPQNMGMETEAGGSVGVIQVPTDANNSFVGMRVSSGLPFPFKLHAMLDNAADGGYENIVSWSGDNGFLVHDKDAFVERIIPKYFSQTKYRSFQRLLNMWGFQRLREGPRKGTYHHEQFQRGNPSLCGSMKCEKIKKKPAAAAAAKKDSKEKENNTQQSASKEKDPPPNKLPEKKVVTFHQATKPGAEAITASATAPLPSFEDTFGQVKQIIPVGKSKSRKPAPSGDSHRYADVFNPATPDNGSSSEPQILPTYMDLFEDRQFHEVSKRDKIARVYGPDSKK